MAWINRTPNGKYMVRWREDGRKRSRVFATEADALTFKWSVEQPDPFASQGAGLAELQYAEEHPEYVVGGGRGPMVVEPERTLAGYIRQMIDSDRDLRDTTRALYLRNLRLHIADTDLGRKDIRAITPDDLRSWWAKLDAGIGARRNVQQLVSKAFNRAVLVGDLEVNPLKRAPEVRRPSKTRNEEVEPLTVAQLEALAEAARAPRRGVVSEMARWRDRLEVLVMGYGGLRAGEVGGLRRQDLVRVNGALPAS